MISSGNTIESIINKGYRTVTVVVSFKRGLTLFTLTFALSQHLDKTEVLYTGILQVVFLQGPLDHLGCFFLTSQLRNNMAMVTDTITNVENRVVFFSNVKFFFQ